MPREFDIDPNMTVEELIQFHQEERDREVRLAREEEAIELEQFAYQFELDKIKGAYDEVSRELDKRKDVMARLVMARDGHEQMGPVDSTHYAPPERPAMDKIDLMEMLREEHQELIARARADLQAFLERQKEVLKELDENVALLVRRYPQLRPFIEGMNYTIIDIPVEFNNYNI